jgi:hypothetical protein
MEQLGRLDLLCRIPVYVEGKIEQRARRFKRAADSLIQFGPRLGEPLAECGQGHPQSHPAICEFGHEHLVGCSVINEVTCDQHDEEDEEDAYGNADDFTVTVGPQLPIEQQAINGRSYEPRRDNHPESGGRTQAWLRDPA